MIKNIIFDFDGTIADTLPLILKVGNDLSSKYGYPNLEPKDIPKYRNYSMKELVKEFKVPVIKLPLLLLDVRARLKDAGMANVEAFTGMVDSLKELKRRGYRLFILTSNSEENVRDFLNHKDLDVFEGIHSENSIFGKDSKIKKLIKEYSLDADETLYVGDEVRDYEACKKIDLAFIGVTWGYNSRERMLKSGVSNLVDSPEQLVKSI